MDWLAEFKYLTARDTVPSSNDLYNSLQCANMDKVEETAALAALAAVAFKRIADLEAKVSFLLRAGTPE